MLGENPYGYILLVWINFVFSTEQFRLFEHICARGGSRIRVCARNQTLTNFGNTLSIQIACCFVPNRHNTTVFGSYEGKWIAQAKQSIFSKWGILMYLIFPPLFWFITSFVVQKTCTCPNYSTLEQYFFQLLLIMAICTIWV